MPAIGAMATWNEWALALQSKGFSFLQLQEISTVQNYQELRDFGLETVEWEEFQPKTKTEIEEMKTVTKAFVETKKPCLFIFEPVELSATSGLKKGYLFNVTEFAEVEKWILENEAVIPKLRFLVTSQVDNPGNGFVGSVFSDGKGKLLCETLHKQGVSNHRVLSQSKEKIQPFLDLVATHEGELFFQQNGFLDAQKTRRLLKTFLPLEGYFEFVFGKHLGKETMVCTGYMPLQKARFPEKLWENLFFDLHGRIRAVRGKNGF